MSTDCQASTADLEYFSLPRLGVNPEKHGDNPPERRHSRSCPCTKTRHPSNAFVTTEAGYERRKLLISRNWVFKVLEDDFGTSIHQDKRRIHQSRNLLDLFQNTSQIHLEQNLPKPRHGYIVRSYDKTYTWTGLDIVRRTIWFTASSRI